MSTSLSARARPEQRRVLVAELPGAGGPLKRESPTRFSNVCSTLVSCWRGGRRDVLATRSHAGGTQRGRRVDGASRGQPALLGSRCARSSGALPRVTRRVAPCQDFLGRAGGVHDRRSGRWRNAAHRAMATGGVPRGSDCGLIMGGPPLGAPKGQTVIGVTHTASHKPDGERGEGAWSRHWRGSTTPARTSDACGSC